MATTTAPALFPPFTRTPAGWSGLCEALEHSSRKTGAAAVLGAHALGARNQTEGPEDSGPWGRALCACILDPYPCNPSSSGKSSLTALSSRPQFWTPSVELRPGGGESRWALCRREAG